MNIASKSPDAEMKGRQTPKGNTYLEKKLQGDLKVLGADGTLITGISSVERQLHSCGLIKVSSL